MKKIWLACLLFLLLPFPAVKAFIGDGSNAVNVGGQLDLVGAISYTKQGENNGPNKTGFRTPEDVALDTTNHRLFVADYLNSRVLVFNLDNSNELVDYTADYVLGKPDFITRALVTGGQANLFMPEGLFYEPTANRLFVADTYTNRVMIFEFSGGISSGMNATYVLGQADFSGSSTATTQTGLWNPKGVFATGGAAVVADTGNNRVLVYNLSDGIANGEAAEAVLCQSDFVSRVTATSQTGCNAPTRLIKNNDLSRLFVADAGNHRVLIFDVSDGVLNGEAALNVLGQPDFVTATSATSQSGMNAPTGVAYDSTANRLFVGETNNNRVLVFDGSDGWSNGENATGVLGHTNFLTMFTSIAPLQNVLFSPQGVTYANDQLWVADWNNHRVMEFNVATVDNGENAVNMAGQTLGGIPSYTKGGPNDGPHAYGLNTPDALAIDSVHHRLFVADTNNNRVLVFELTVDDELTDYQADFVLGQSSFLGNASAISQSGLFAPTGVVYDSANDRLLVSDYGNSRVVIFDTSNLSNGMNASTVLGQETFITNNNSTPLVDGLALLQDLDYDSVNQRLFVADYFNHRVMVFNGSDGFSNGEDGVCVLGQESFDTKVTALDQDGFNGPFAVAYDEENQRLFVADWNNNRVMVFDLSAGCQNGMDASFVLGQADFVSNGGAVTQNSVWLPSGLEYAPDSQRLFVADLIGSRVMVFDLAGGIQNGMNAANVLGKANFTSSGQAATQSQLAGAQGVYYLPSTGQLWVADTGNHRVMVFDASVLLEPTSPDNLSASVLGTTSFTLSWTDNASNFDQEDNMVVKLSTTSANDGFATTVATLPADTTSLEINNLNPNTQYWFRVEASNGAGVGISTALSVVTLASGGSSQPSGGANTLAAQVNLTASLGDHRYRSLLRLVNQVLSGERPIPGRVTLAEQLAEAAGKKNLGTLADLLGNDRLKALLVQLVSQDNTLRGLLRGQRSDQLILEVRDGGQVVATVNDVSTNLFGQGQVTLPSLPVKAYTFCLRKPYGLCQTLTNKTLEASMALTFPGSLRVGDVSGDGKIDLTDFKAFMEQLGTAQYDFNEDGQIDLRDVADFLEGLRGE